MNTETTPPASLAPAHLLGFRCIMAHGFHLEKLDDGEIVAHPSTPAQQLQSIESVLGAQPLKKPLSILLEAAVPENLPEGSNLRWVDGSGTADLRFGAAELTV